MKTTRLPIALAIAALPLALHAQEKSLSEVVVTAPQMRDPLVIVNDPKAPQVPVPANDGASFLKNIPGFNVIRKAGTDGDPVLRGLAGSRLNVLLDGAEFHGGCGMRMDPPTAYVFPETFDRVTVVKGPQTVRYGNGNLAGVVLFERDPKPFTESGVRAGGSLMAGSWGRVDLVGDGTFGTPNFYLRGTGSYSDSDDYEDGDGKRVHSFFTRKSVNVAGGWTPDQNTRLELSAVRSEAKAAYADRTMDGVLFDRDGYGVKFEKKRISDVLRKVEAQYNYNYIDHVMDNYSLRPRNGNFMWNSPDRETHGLRASADLGLGQAAVLTVGVDRQENSHTLRTHNGATLVSVDAKPRIKDLEATTTGLFGELTYALGDKQRLIGGLRHDKYAADRYNTTTSAAMGSTDENLNGGFVRYEFDFTPSATAYVGLGRAQRGMDHWEATTYNGLTATGKLSPETNTQLDAGLIWNGANLTGSVSGYYSKMSDYVLTYSSMAQGACPAGTRNMMSGVWNCSFNIDAARYGMEADVAWRFASDWTMRGSYAYVHADNDTMNVPLAQTPPHEVKLGVDYKTGPWTVGSLVRVVGKQDRVHVSYGNIVGQDLGATGGFATVALNGSYRLNKMALLSAGIDNLFDRTYAEHISRSGATVAGYSPATARVNEPGRFFWVKASLSFN